MNLKEPKINNDSILQKFAKIKKHSNFLFINENTKKLK